MGPSGRVTFRVVWGDPFHGLTQELVEAHDADEALTLAQARRPELPRPRTAYLITPTPG
ncbi:MAG: hypothetical protein ACHQFZ_03515 [Acidimicrobiales bacterium]